MATKTKISRNFNEVLHDIDITIPKFLDRYISVTVQDASSKSNRTRFVKIKDIKIYDKDNNLLNPIAGDNFKNDFEQLIKQWRSLNYTIKLDNGSGKEEDFETITDFPDKDKLHYYEYDNGQVPTFQIHRENNGTIEGNFIKNQQAYKVVRNKNLDFSDPEYSYVAVKLVGESKVRLVNISEIKFIDASGNLQPVNSLADIPGGPTLFSETFTSAESSTAEFNFVLEEDGQIRSLESVFIDASYRLEPATEIYTADGKDKVEDIEHVGGYNLGNYTSTNLTISQREDGSSYISLTTAPIDRFYVEQKIDANANPNEPAYINYECYELDLEGDGKYLKIKYKTDTADTIVALDYLFLDKNGGQSLKDYLSEGKDKKDIIGKPLYVQTKDNSYVETEPLTAEQVHFSYNEKKFMYETTKEDAIAKDEENQEAAYLLLKDGRFVKEADVVQPKCYDFCENQMTTDFAAYLVINDKNPSKPESFIISKDFKGLKIVGDVVQIQDKDFGIISFNKNKLKKLRISNNIHNCDIIQTTSQDGREIEKCSILRKPDKLALDDYKLPQNSEEYQARIKEIYKEFLKDYKARGYDIGDILRIETIDKDGNVKEEFVEYVKNHRYMYSSVVPFPDEVTESLKFKASEFNSNQDGTISGGPTYSAAQGIKDAYSKLTQATTYTLGFTFSAGGVVASLISPLLMVVPMAALAAGYIATPIFQLIKKARIQQGNFQFKNRNEEQNKKIKQNAFEKIEDLVEQVKERYYTGLSEAKSNKDKFSLSENDQNIFLSQLRTIECEILIGLAQNKNGGIFRKDGNTGVINKVNAYEFTKYNNIITEKLEQKEKLEKRYKNLETKISSLKNKSKASYQLTELEQEFAEVSQQKSILEEELNKLLTNFILSGTNNPADEEQLEILKRIESAKQFILARYFGKKEYLDKCTKEGLTGDDQLAVAKFIKNTDIEVHVKQKEFGFVKAKQVGSKEEKTSTWSKGKKLVEEHHIFESDVDVSEIAKEPKIVKITNIQPKVVEDETLKPTEELSREHTEENTEELGDELGDTSETDDTHEEPVKPINEVEEPPINPDDGSNPEEPNPDDDGLNPEEPDNDETKKPPKTPRKRTSNIDGQRRNTTRKVNTFEWSPSLPISENVKEFIEKYLPKLGKKGDKWLPKFKIDSYNTTLSESGSKKKNLEWETAYKEFKEIQKSLQRDYIFKLMRKKDEEKDKTKKNNLETEIKMITMLYNKFNEFSENWEKRVGSFSINKAENKADL